MILKLIANHPSHGKLKIHTMVKWQVFTLISNEAKKNEFSPNLPLAKLVFQRYKFLSTPATYRESQIFHFQATAFVSNLVTITTKN